MLWRCWLGDRKGIRTVKTERWSAGVVICLERDADLHMAQLMPLPRTVSCFSKIQIGCTLLVPAYLGSPGKRAVKRVCVCVCVCVLKAIGPTPAAQPAYLAIGLNGLLLFGCKSETTSCVVDFTHCSKRCEFYCFFFLFSNSYVSFCILITVAEG